MPNRILVLGVGNILRGDDGIGPTIIEILQKQGRPQVDLVDGGTDGLALLDLISNYQRAIIIDAVDMGLPVGEIRSFLPQEAKITINSDALTTHGFGLAEVITLAEELGVTTKIEIIGIQPRCIEFNAPLSPEIKAQISVIVKQIDERLAK